MKHADIILSLSRGEKLHDCKIKSGRGPGNEASVCACTLIETGWNLSNPSLIMDAAL